MESCLAGTLELMVFHAHSKLPQLKAKFPRSIPTFVQGQLNETISLFMKDLQKLNIGASCRLFFSVQSILFQMLPGYYL